jgi:hypothetical protein
MKWVGGKAPGLARWVGGKAPGGAKWVGEKAGGAAKRVGTKLLGPRGRIFGKGWLNRGRLRIGWSSHQGYWRFSLRWKSRHLDLPWIRIRKPVSTE